MPNTVPDLLRAARKAAANIEAAKTAAADTAATIASQQGQGVKPGNVSRETSAGARP